MSTPTSLRCAALLAFVCGFMLGGGPSSAATPAGAATLAALDSPAAPVVGLSEVTPVRIAEEDVDDEGEGDNDNAGGGQRVSLVAPPTAAPAGSRMLVEDETDDDGDDTDEGDDEIS